MVDKVNASSFKGRNTDRFISFNKKHTQNNLQTLKSPKWKYPANSGHINTNRVKNKSNGTKVYKRLAFLLGGVTSWASRTALLDGIVLYEKHHWYS